MNGVTNVALNKPAIQSSSITTATTVLGDPNFAVDGLLTTTAQTFAAISTGNKLAGKQFLRVDLGVEYSVTSITYVSGATSTATGNNLQVLMGTNADVGQATLCFGPATTFGGTWTTTGNSLPACKGSARYVFISKSASASLVAATAQAENTLMVKEIYVYAERLIGLPVARAAPGFTTFGSYLVLFGGHTADYQDLSDMRFFDLTLFSWLPTPSAGLEGREPSERSYASLAVVPAPYTPPLLGAKSWNQIVVFGGMTVVYNYNDLFLMNIPVCPALITTGVQGSPLCSTAGLACSYTCATGYTTNNPTSSIYCRVDGSWSGNSQLCIAGASLLPTAPTITTAVAGGTAGTVVVSWTPPPGVNTGFIVTPSACDQSSLFTFGYTALTSNGWVWYNGDSDNTATNSYTFDSKGNLVIAPYTYDATASGTATSGECNYNVQRCGFFLAPFPTTVAGLSASVSYAIESFVSFDMFGKNRPSSEQLIGVGIYNTNVKATGVTRTGQWAVFAGIRYFQAGCTCPYSSCGATCTNQQLQVGLKSFLTASSPSWWVGTPESSPVPGGIYSPSTTPIAWYSSAYVRLERTVSAPVTAVPSWRVGYKFEAAQVWTYSPYYTDTEMIGATYNAAYMRLGIMASNSNQASRGYGTFSYFKVGTLACVNTGFQTQVDGASTSATVSGLSAVPYTFTVTAVNSYGRGVTSAASSSVTPTAATGPGYTSASLVNAALNKQAYQTSTLGTNIATLAVDASTTTFSSTSSGTSTSSSMGDVWWVDLGAPLTVNEISITNVNNPATYTFGVGYGFRVLVGNSNIWQLATPCDQTQIPATIGNGATSPRFPCTSPTGLVGRYVFIQALQTRTPTGTTQAYLQLADVNVWVPPTCTAARATPTGGTTTTGCAANAAYGSACTQACNTGRVITSGATTSNCNGVNYNDLPLICSTTCGSMLAGPTALSIKCNQTLYSTFFASDDGLWFDGRTSPQSLGQRLTIADGFLQAQARPGCGGEILAIAGSTPAGTSVKPFTWKVALSSTGDRVGIIWRYVDAANFYRVVLNPASGVHSVERMVAGVSTEIATTTKSINTFQMYELSVSSPISNLNMYNVTLDGVPLFGLVDKTFVSGFPGVYAATAAFFDYALYSVDCTGFGCQNNAVGQMCSFTCPVGFNRLFSNVSTCVSGIGWDWPTAYCQIMPPLFVASTTSVPENSAAKTIIGSPLQASLAAPDYELVFGISNVYHVTPWNTSVVPQAMWPFTVDSCSGQLSVISQQCTGAPNCAILNYEDPLNNVYAVTVSVVPNGPLGFLTGFSVSRNVTVKITNVDEPPTISATAAVPLAENSPPGTVVGTVPFFDPDTPASLISCTLVVTNPFFTLVPGSCTLVVTSVAAARDSLNFESVNNAYTLSVFVQQLDVPANSGVGSFSITLTDADDPPTLTLTSVVVSEDPLSLYFGTTPVGFLSVANLTWADQDSVSSPYFSGVPSFSVIPASSQSLYPECAVAAPLSYGTSSGAVNDTTIFRVDPWTDSLGGKQFSLGMISAPTGAASYASLYPFVYGDYGLIVKAVYAVCLQTTDSFGAVSAQAIQVLVNASITSAVGVRGTFTWTSGTSTNLPTAGGAVFTVRTTNACFFNCVGWSIANAYKIYVQISGYWGTFIGPECLPTAANVYSCQTPAGVGAYVSASMTSAISILYQIPGTGITKPVAYDTVTSTHLVTFARPVVTSVANTAGWPTAGYGATAPQSPTAVVVFTGSNFGPQMNVELNVGKMAFPTITWGPSGIYSCVGFDPSPTPQTELRCRVGQGAGAGLTWSIYNNPALAVITSSPSFSYAAPIITSVTGLVSPLGALTNMGALLGRGGQLFHIEGSNFGPNPTGAVDVTALSVQFVGFLTVSALLCSRDAGLAGHTGITCTTPSAYGYNYALNVTVARQATVAPGLLSYAPPMITSITGPGVYRAPTRGGSFVLLSGYNFGPLGSIPESVTYGHPPLDFGRYTATSCAVQSADTVMNCTLSPGVGAGHAWVITLGAQASNLYYANTSYSPPIISYFSGPGSALADTAGMQTVVISGSNFGPNDAYTLGLLSVYYDTNLGVPVQGGVTNIRFTPSYLFPCAITSMDVGGVFNESITCTTVEGAGKNLAWHILLDGQVNIRPSTTFRTPTISRLLDVGGNAVAPIPGVACPAAEDLTALCGAAPAVPGTDAVFTACLASHRERYIANCFCSLPAVPTYDCTPWTTDQLADTTCATRLAAAAAAAPTSSLCAAPPLGNATSVIAEGNFFGPSPYANVLAAGAPSLNSLIQAVTYGPTGTEYKATAFNLAASGANTQRLTFTLVPGYGVNLYVRVWVADVMSQYENEAFRATFSYAQASVLALSPSTAASDGISYSLITVKAQNLPPVSDPNYYVSVLLGNVLYAADGTVAVGAPCTPNCAQPWQTSKNLLLNTNNQFSLPSGAGQGRFVQLVTTLMSQGISRYSAPTPVALFDYAPPVITRVTVTKVSWATYNVQCPFSAAFTASYPQWDCNSVFLTNISIYGTGFGSLLGTAPTLAFSGDGVSKVLSLQVNSVGSFIPHTIASQLYLYKWTPSAIVAFAFITNGTVQVSLSSTGGITGGSCTTDGAPDLYGVTGFSACAPSYDTTATGTFRALSPEVTTLSWTPCFTLSPCTAPTQGATMTITVLNLNPGDDLRVHLGDPLAKDSFGLPDTTNYFGTATVILTGYAGMVDATNVVDLVQKQLALGTGSVTVKFTAPSAQGLAVAVIVERVTGAQSDFSSSSVSVRYADPVLTTFDVVGPSPTFAVLAQNLDATTFASVATAATIGGSYIRLRGTNLGIRPTVAMGKSAGLPSSSLTDCSAPTGAGNCWLVAAPAGEGTGMRQYVGDPGLSLDFCTFSTTTPVCLPNLNGFRANYYLASWPTWPGGYFVWLFTNQPSSSIGVSAVQSARPIVFYYALPNVTAVVSLDVSGTFPAAGGTRVRVLGSNFGDPASSLTVRRVFLGTAATGLECVSPVLSVGLVGVEGIECTLPVGTPGASYAVTVAVADRSSTSAANIVTYDPNPAIDSILITLADGRFYSYFDYTLSPTAMARIPTDGARVSICGRYFSALPSVVVALSYTTGVCASPMGSCCVNMTVAPGEGYGYNWHLSTEPTNGFRILVTHGSQTSSVPVSYEYATVSKVVSADGTFPTAGGVTIWVIGSNFGNALFCNTSNLLFLPCPDVVAPVVEIGLDSLPPQAGDFSLCGNLVRVNSTAMSCLLPEGVGKGLSVRVSIAHLPPVTFTKLITYDHPYLTPPYISMVGSNATSRTYGGALPGATYTSVYPLLGDSTWGGATLTFYGKNFGKPNTQSCVYLAWAARPVVNGEPLAPVCDGYVSFLGEGEVPPSYVVSWNDTTIVVTVPPGLGWKELGVSARGARLALGPGSWSPIAAGSPNLMYMRYADPVIFSLTPSLVNTDGITNVTLKGANFGPQPLTVAQTAPVFSAEDGVGLSSAYLVITFGYGCSSVPYQLDGSSVEAYYSAPGDLTSSPVSNCMCTIVVRNGVSSCASSFASQIISVHHDTVVFTAPPGIGKNVTMRVYVVEPTSIVYSSDPTLLTGVVVLPASNNTANLQLSVTPPFFAGYLPPVIEIFSPRVVFLPISASSGVASGAIVPISVQMLGENFGLIKYARAQNWRAEDYFVAGSIDSRPCLSIARQDGPLGGMLVCTFDAAQSRVGFPPVSVFVAGQNSTFSNGDVAGSIDRASALLLVCGAGSYGRFNTGSDVSETCIPCPTCLPGTTACATCPGYVPTPVNQSWFTWDVAADSCTMVAEAACPTTSTFCNLTGAVRASDGACVAVSTDDGACTTNCLLGDGTPGRLSKAYAGLGYICTALASACSFAGSCAAPAARTNTDAWFRSPCFSHQFHYPVALPGFYNLDGPMFSSCDADVAARSVAVVNNVSGSYTQQRAVCIVPCEPPGACLGANVCAEGYASVAPIFRCASCAPGFYAAGGGNCRKCPDSPYVLLVGIIVLVMAIAGVGYYFNKKQVNIAVISIGVDFFQVLAIFANLRIKWPPMLLALWNVLSAFNLNINIVPPECLVPKVSYATKFYIIMFLPILILTAFFLLYLVGAAKKFVMNGIRNKREVFSNGSMLVASSMLLMYLMYLYLTRTVMDVFVCAPSQPPDGNLYFLSTMEKCTSPISGTQAQLMPLALFALLVYSIGYPAYLARTLYKYRETAMEDQILRAKGVGNDKMTNPNALWMRRMFGRSYFQFKPDLFFWVLVIIARKACIAVTATFNRNAAFQMAACLLIIFLAYSVQVQVRPYMSVGEFEGVLKAHETAAATDMVHARIKVAISDIAAQGKKRVTKNLLSVQGKVDRKALMGLLGGWLMNYNTVEAVMLFSTVIVCVMALMFVVRV